ncbi:hypothetical protein BE20_46120 [Sorangium cellulosum]|uniref:Uncharacterized protein n=1 Tax=Sorangium cellulosum TaxID=56 RepID=A0A150S7S6_SORCE|nr:hypothetical protein BE18_45200 [Sorangium cellulosum]KYF95265.1 hypothetical protein BE20_46120 [Sorangium cellulosum]
MKAPDHPGRSAYGSLTHASRSTGVPSANHLMPDARTFDPGPPRPGSQPSSRESGAQMERTRIGRSAASRTARARPCGRPTAMSCSLAPEATRPSISASVGPGLRLRETLRGLARGLSEKEIAAEARTPCTTT